MKIDIVDMNLASNQDWWCAQKENSMNYVYVYSFPKFYMDRKEADAYVFLWDDGKEKHESYEVYLIMPYSNPHRIEETFYGADKEEAVGNMLKWIDEHINFINELNKGLCEALLDSREKCEAEKEC